MVQEASNGLMTIQQPTPLALPSHLSLLEPGRFAQAMQVAHQIAKTELVPKQFRDNAAAIVVAWEMGGELGLSPMASLQNIAVINGRPSVWGDSLPAICMRHPQWGGMVEKLNDKATEATCTVIRKDAPESIVRTFSLDDAKTAGLLGKDGPWRNYPKRMLQMRARAFALRDAFPDALRGMHVAEEVVDGGTLQTVSVTPIPRLAPDAVLGDVLVFIEAARSEADLAPVGLWADGKPDETRAAVKKAYLARLTELRKPPEGKTSFGKGNGKAKPAASAVPLAEPEVIDPVTGEVHEQKTVAVPITTNTAAASSTAAGF